MKKEQGLIPVEVIERKIYLVRGVKVMLDSDLAMLYGVSVKRLNEQVKRNLKRFPVDFMFQLKGKEAQNMRSQIATASWGGRRTLPYVFTEHGVTMLASVLNSQKAIEISIYVVRAFIKIREMLATHKDLLLEFDKIRKIQKEHGENISLIMNVITKLISTPPELESEREPLGFRYRGKSKK